jgi:hypothetical protein
MRLPGCVVIVIAGVLVASSARADGLLLEAGVGAPGGITFGLGVRDGPWQAIGEVGGAAAAFVGMLSASAHLHRDVHTWSRGRLTLAVGASATRLGWMAGSDDLASGAVDTFGPTVQLRRTISRRSELVFEGGPVFGRCRGDCDPRPFVFSALGLRVIRRL